jgi:hypothetical protein
MSLHRIALFAIAALFTAGMTSAASAGCCDRGLFTSYVATGCGGCGTPTAAIVYAQPVAPAPPPVPVTVSTWTAGCGCQQPVAYAAPVVQPMPIAPAPIYVVNQGPDYTGPGIMVPYHTWSSVPVYAPPTAYPYAPGYGYGAPGPRVAFSAHMYRRPLPVWHTRWYHRYHR